VGVLDADDLARRRYFLFRQCRSQQELHDWIVAFIGIDFPDCTVDPDSNSNPMALLWEIYSKALSPPGEDEGAFRILAYANRTGYKTLVAGVLEVLSLFHLGRDFAHMAAVEGQAQKAQSYVKEANRRPYLRDFVVLDNERQVRIARYYNPKTEHSLTVGEYERLSDDAKAQHGLILHDYDEKARYGKVVICTMAGSNSEHVPFFIADELDVVSNPAAFAEAKSIPAARDGMIPITFYLSTRKSSIGLVQKEIDKASQSGLQIRHWNVIDLTKRCEPKRHRPDLPRLPLYRNPETLHHVTEAGFGQLTAKQQESYIRDDGAFAGCASCKLYPMCRGNLVKQTSTSPLLSTIPVTIAVFSDKDLDYAKAQLLCLRPSQKGKIYARFDKSRHVLTPAKAYQKVFGEFPPESLGGAMMTKATLRDQVVARELPWSGGMDFGDAHDFAAPVGFRDGKRAFLMYCPGGSELEPDQQVEACQVFKDLRPDIYPDPSNPGMIRMFKARGFSMRKWSKNAGSVQAGISQVQAMLSPILDSEPHFFIVCDVDEDPGIDIVVDQFQDYSWATNAQGNPTGQPKKEYDDYVDAVRYWLMNVFGKGRGVQPAAADEAEAPTGMAANAAAETWHDEAARLNAEVVSRTIAAATGVPFEPAPRVFKVEAPEGSGFRSYYAEEEPVKPGKRGAAKGRRGNLHWDIT